MAFIDIVPGLDQRSIHQVGLGDPSGPNVFGGGGGFQTPGANFNVQQSADDQFRRQQGVGQQGTFAQGVSFDNFDPFVRDVKPEELTSRQLTSLLESQNPYIQNARRRGQEAAAARGGLSSSIYAGAAERSAIEAGAPIAQADAMAHIQAASENLQALNTNIMGRMQAASSLATARVSAGAQVQASQIAAEANKYIARLRTDAEKEMQQAMFGQQEFMENLEQQGRIELTQLTGKQRERLAEMGFTHDINMADLTHQQRIEIEETFNQPRWEAEFDLATMMGQAQLMTGMWQTIGAGLNSMNGLDIDDEARQRGEEWWMNFGQQGFSFLRNLAEQYGFPVIDFGGGG